MKYIERVAMNINELKKEGNIGTKSGVTFDYGIVTLGDTAALRLPCYNISLQCAHEMVNDDVGGFIQDPNELYVLARTNNQKVIKLRRKPLSLTMLLAAQYWPVWEIGKFSETEKLDMLIKVMKAEDKVCDYGPDCKKKKPAEALRLKCLRLFRDHLRDHQTSKNVIETP